MSNLEGAPLMAGVSEIDVEMDSSLLDAYMEERLAAIMKGERVWVRRSFETKKVIYDLYQNREYLGNIESYRQGFLVNAKPVVETVSHVELGSRAPISLEEAQMQLMAQSQQPDLFLPE